MKNEEEIFQKAEIGFIPAELREDDYWIHLAKAKIELLISSGRVPETVYLVPH